MQREDKKQPNANRDEANRTTIKRGRKPDAGKPPVRENVAVNPLPTPLTGDQNLVSPETRAQEASYEPYAGSGEMFRTQPETDRSGVRRDPEDILEDEHKPPGRRESDQR